MEIPEFIYPIVFSLVACFIIYAIAPPQVNYVSAPISNFTNVTKKILYTADEPDYITKAIYRYGGLTNTANALNQSKEQVIRQLAKSQTFFLNCTFTKAAYFGAPFTHKQDCNILGEKYSYIP